jgi:hypothetical protein
MGALVSQVSRVFGGIAVADTQKNNQTLSDASNFLTVNRHRSFGNPLNNCSHRNPASSGNFIPKL